MKALPILSLGVSIGVLFSSAAIASAQNWDAFDKNAKKANQWFEENKGKQYKIEEAGDLQKSGKFQTPGNIQVPKGWDAIKTKTEDCNKRLILCADTLFEFDKATLTADAESTLKLIGPQIKEMSDHPMVIEGHTDAIGTDEYNQSLSERRAERVKNWLLQNHYIDQADIIGYGKKKPVAPNTLPDGKDNPKGRQQNRRVEIVVDTCKTLSTMKME